VEALAVRLAASLDVLRKLSKHPVEFEQLRREQCVAGVARRTVCEESEGCYLDSFAVYIRAVDRRATVGAIPTRPHDSS